MGQNTNITVTVDTGRIHSGNVNTCVVFSDDRNDPPQQPGKPEDYVSSVNRNMKVTWEGVAMNGQDIIEITDVSRKTSTSAQILEQSNYKGKDGKIEAKVKDENVTGEESYNLTFRIKDGNSYQIDPKLLMV